MSMTGKEKMPCLKQGFLNLPVLKMKEICFDRTMF